LREELEKPDRTHDTHYPVPCTHYPVLNTLYSIPCTQYPVPNTQYSIQKILNQHTHECFLERRAGS
jgi:hypothetical protein